MMRRIVRGAPPFAKENAMNSSYADVVLRPPQQSLPDFSTRSSDPTNQQQVEQMRGRLADSIGATVEVAKATGIPEQATHEIVSRAYRQSW
jgi:hypothetical protein